MKLFCDTQQAASLLGVSMRTFERKYLYTGKVRLLRFGKALKAGNRGDKKHMFLRADVEKLK